MTSPQLEGAELFDAAAKAIGWLDAMPEPWLFDAQWLLVPAMLEWLRGRVSVMKLTIFADGEAWAEASGELVMRRRMSPPDLPTALARLVLRVAELEKNEGGKP